MVSWEIPEYTKYPHGRRWYVIAGILVLGILVYAIWSKNYLFGVLTVLVLLIIIMHEVKEPRKIFFGITEKGIVVDDRLLPHGSVERFWIVENERENEAALFLDFKSMVRPRMSVPVSSELTGDVRDALGSYVAEDEEKSKIPFSDSFGRWFKI